MRTPVRTLWPAVVLAVALVASSASAQVDVHASLNRETVEVGETVDLNVAVTGAMLGVEPPRIPQIDYLSVVSTASQNNIQFVNGEMTRTTVFTYGLRASREGTYTIPALDVPVQDDVYTTDPLTLNVIPAASPLPAPPGPGQPGAATAPSQPGDPDAAAAEDTRQQDQPEEIEVTTEVDTRTPWVGEQVTLTLQFLQAHTIHLMGNAEYDPPSTEGLVAEPLPDRPQRTTTINNVPYEVITRRTALFAPAPGEYTIGPATVTFRRGFMYDEETLTTEPITLKVRPLPTEGRPEGFSGAVGQLQLGMSLPASEVRVGEAASLQLTITGTGDLRQLAPPEVQVEGDARVYQSGEDRQIAPQDTARGPKIGGRVTFDYLIMPRTEGTLTVKPIVVHYFNPGVDRYQSAQSTSATITVLPGEAGQTVAEPGGDELRYIRDDDLALRAAPPVTSRLWFWLLQGVPVAGVGWALRERAERLRREKDPRYRRRVEAAREAHASLRAIRPTEDPAEVYHRADETLAAYIAARTGGSAASISPEAAHERLTEAGVSDELASRASETLRRLRAGAYAPGASDAPAPNETVGEVRSLVGALEEALR